MTAKRSIVIVGAGLGGAFAAHGLASSHDVTVVEVDAAIDEWQQRIVDVGRPAHLNPHVGAGLGGTTTLWHNALIEIDDRIFAQRWPISKAELAPFYAEAFEHLAGFSHEVSDAAAMTLRHKYADAGIQAARAPHLCCPLRRRNAWDCLGLSNRVRLCRGEVVGFVTERNIVRAVEVRSAAGVKPVAGDVVILAAGGLGTPPLLQMLARQVAFSGAGNVGCFYEDHPMAFIGELTLRRPLHRLWNFRLPGANANLRMSFVVEEDGLQISFQLRPSMFYQLDGRRQRIHSAITQVRNQPYNVMNYLRLLRRWDDVFDILSFRFDVQVPTKHYSLLMVAEQPPLPARAVWGELGSRTGDTLIRRNWVLLPDYLATLRRAAERFIAEQRDLVVASRFFAGWEESLATAAHHSGTARMSATPSTGVCDRNARVHGLANLYVCDGSLIPASGIANTGLTIAALALRLAEHLAKR